jgi:hypothetical protein
MNGLRRGYKRPETGYYRELFIKKYINMRPKRDFLGMIHWVHEDTPQRVKPPRESLAPGITVLIVMLVIIACFALAVMCALPFRLLTW